MRIASTCAPSRRLRVVVLALLMAASHLAAAPAAGQLTELAEDGQGRWVEVDRGEHGSVFLDAAAIDPVGEDLFQVRTRWSFTRAQRNEAGVAYRSSLALRVVDCRSGEMALIAYADRNGTDTVDAAVMPLFAARWDPARPNTVAGRILAAVCRLGHRPATAPPDAALAVAGGTAP